ncbi:MAG TPA: hypothetical protein VIN75_07805 [Burkholderiaceae bacterium]
MRHILRLAAFALAAALAAPAFASPTSDALSACLVDKSTGRDRKDLARWIVVAVSSHPDMQDMFVLNQAMRETANKTAADIIMRLVTVECVDQARASAAVDGGSSWGQAFGKLGEVAMKELTTNPAVATSFEDPVKYMDRAQLMKVFAPKP